MLDEEEVRAFAARRPSPDLQAGNTLRQQDGIREKRPPPPKKKIPQDGQRNPRRVAVPGGHAVNCIAEGWFMRIRTGTRITRK